MILTVVLIFMDIFRGFNQPLVRFPRLSVGDRTVWRRPPWPCASSPRRRSCCSWKRRRPFRGAQHQPRRRRSTRGGANAQRASCRSWDLENVGDFLSLVVVFFSGCFFYFFCWLVGVFSCLIYIFLLAKNRDFPVGKGVKDLTLNHWACLAGLLGR